MKKGVAIPYVIALILGIAVIGLVGAWFVISGGRFGKQATETTCLNKAVEFCARKIARQNLEWSSFAPNCNTNGLPKLSNGEQFTGDECNQLIPT